MKRSFKALLAAVAILTVMCAGAAFAADEAEVDIKMGKSTLGSDGHDTTHLLPNDELRLWVTRRVGSRPEDLNLIDADGRYHLHAELVLFSAKPTAEAEDQWLTDRTQIGQNMIGIGGISGTKGIGYGVQGSSITLSADVNAVSGDRATIYVYGGRMDDPNQQQKITSVQAYDGQSQLGKNIAPFPSGDIVLDNTAQNGGVIASFKVLVLSSDADLLIEQIEADQELSGKVASGLNVVEKDARGNVIGVNKNKDKADLPHIIANLADGTVELVVISSDAKINIDSDHVQGMNANDAQAYLRTGESHDGDANETTVFALKPSIDPSGTITYLIGGPDMLLAIIDHLATDPNALFHIDFDDLSSKYGRNIPEYSVRLSFSQPSGGGSSCAAGAFAPLALAALAAIRRRKR